MEPLSQKLIQMGGQSPTGYWITEITSSSPISAKKIKPASSDGAHCLAENDSGWLLLRFTVNGVLDRQWRFAAVNGDSYDIATNSLEDILAVGDDFLNSTVGRGSALLRVSNTGTVLESSYFHYSFMFEPVRNAGITGCLFDNSDQAIMCGFTTLDYTSYNAYVKKSGLWESAIQSNSRLDAGVIVDNFNGDIFAAGSTGTNLELPLFVKYNSSGTRQWTKTLGSGGNSEQFLGLSGRGNSRRYIVGSTKSIRSSLSDVLTCCYDSNGSIVWQRALSGGSGNNIGRAISTETFNNTIVVGEWGNGMIIAKYNLDGALQWQRILTSTAGNISPRGVQLIGSTAIYVIAQLSGSNTILVCRLREDGGGTGTFGSYTYAAGSASDVVTALAESNVSLTQPTITPGGSGGLALSFDNASVTQSTLLIA